MRYQGGKSRIAKRLASKIREMHPSATEIWEPFCGGGAMTLALSNVDFRVHASDIHEDLILMWQALMRGETEPFVDVTKEEYSRLKLSQSTARRGFVGFGSSFGGHWWGGFGRDVKHGPGHQPFEESRRFCQLLVDKSIIFTHTDYSAVPDNVLVYADPPYIGTKPYKGSSAFDHTAFWNWVRNRTGPTFVSELTCPYPDIEIVWRKQHKSQNASNSPTTKATSQIISREERLYYKP